MSRDALIIGINNYKASTVLNSLRAPANDAEGVAKILDKYGDFATEVKRFPETRDKKDEPYRVCDRQSVGSRQLMKVIANFLNPVGKQVPSMVLLYFSGHGVQDQLGKTVEGHLATSDCDLDSGSLGVSLTWLRGQLEQCEARQQVVILDCCHSGDLLKFWRSIKNEYRWCRALFYSGLSRY